MKLVCLLPVRNGESDLPGYFESAARFADAVVALDDGSDDGTRAHLEREPLVAEILTNSPRRGFAGWHDAENRNRLLEAAATHTPYWIISIDADERIDAGDAEALRAFLESDALPGIAYGFRCYSMVGGLETALPLPIWVYRLFAFQPGQRFPDQQLHFAPIPTSISRQAFLRTTLRIQHLGGMSPERRLARYEKYRQADPECRYWPDYSGLLKEPSSEEVIDWQPREPGWPVIYPGDAAMSEPTRIEANASLAACVSIVVLNDGPRRGVLRALESANDQPHGESTIEFFVVTRDGRAAPGDARIVTVDAAATRGVMRNAALAAATGRHVLFLDSDLSLLPEAVERLIAGFERGFASVTGGVVNLGKGFAEAMYEIRFGRLRAGKPEGILEHAPPWACFARMLLDDLGTFDEGLRAGEEIEFGHRLTERGYVTLRLAQPILAYHGDSAQRWPAGLGDAFRSGRAVARTVLNANQDRGEVLTRELAKLYGFRGAFGNRPEPNVHLGRRTKRSRGLLTLAQRAGVWTEVARPGRGKFQVLLGRPGGIALVVAHRLNGEPTIALVRFEMTFPRLRAVVLPAGLQIPSSSGGTVSLGVALELPSRSSMPGRFTVNDAVGRPFQLWIDELVWLDGDSEVGMTARFDMESMLDKGHGSRVAALGRLPDLLALSRAARGRIDVVSTFSGTAAALALLSLNRITREDMDVIQPFRDGEILDDHGVELVRSFLGDDEIKRPRTRRSALRQVEWA